MKITEIKKNVYWVGAIDWDIRDFHGYSTPIGTTYNAFLIKDKKNVLFDTVKKPFASDHIKQIKQIIDLDKIDYIVINHVEMDHSGSLPEIVKLVNPEKIICSANGKKALLKHFNTQNWPIEVVASGDSINVGEKTIKFIETKMLHWPDSMFSYIPEDKLLISQDGFGHHMATSERFDDEVDIHELLYHAEKYYANILLPYSTLIQRLLTQIKELNLEIDMIAPDHGVIWRSHVSEILESYDKWSKQITTNKAVVVYDTMWKSTTAMAKAIAEGLQQNGASVKVMNTEFYHRSDIITEIMDAKAIVIGSATLNNGMLPRVADFLCYLKGLRPVGRVGAAFGSYGWGGEAVKLINASMQEMNIELLDDGIRVNYVPNEEELVKCIELGKKIADAIK